LSHRRPRNPDKAARAAIDAAVAVGAVFDIETHIRAVKTGLLDGLARSHLLRCVFPAPSQPLALGLPSLTAHLAVMADTIYEERAFDCLPILADALEDAGCTSNALLGHLRSPGPHVRGCWALDLVLARG
jgi:hypothetical protein